MSLMDSKVYNTSLFTVFDKNLQGFKTDVKGWTQRIITFTNFKHAYAKCTEMLFLNEYYTLYIDFVQI